MKYIIEVEALKFEKYNVVIESEKSEEDIERIYEFPRADGDSLEHLMEMILKNNDSIVEIEATEKGQDIEVLDTHRVK